MAQAAVAFNDVFEESDVEAPKNIHHIRANSSIMQLNKLLGEFPTIYLESAKAASSKPENNLLTRGVLDTKSPTVVKSVSSPLLIPSWLRQANKMQLSEYVPVSDT